MKCKKNYKDMKKYKAYKRRNDRRYYAKTATYEKVEWTPEQEELVLKHEMTDTQLSNLIGHSVKAIQIKRCRLKKLLKMEELLNMSQSQMNIFTVGEILHLYEKAGVTIEINDGKIVRFIHKERNKI